VEDRQRLPHRKTPYYQTLAKGLSLGLYLGPRGSAWKVRLENPRHEEVIGVPEEEAARGDDYPILSYEAAVSTAKKWREEKLRTLRAQSQGPVPSAKESIPANPTVRDALLEYLADLETRQVEAKGTARSRIEKIIREIGHLRLRDLTTKDLTDWQAAIVNSPPQRRPKKDGSPNFAKNYDPNNPKSKLRRQSTSNRCLADLKAALNRAYNNQWVGSDQGWRAVKAFEDCTGKREEVLDAAQQSDFLNGCTPEFRPLAYGALLTAAHYTAMTKWKVKDFHPVDRYIKVGFDKRNHRDRLAPLTNEAIAVFFHICMDRDPEEPIFLKANGKPWGRNHQARPMGEGTKAADIDVTFYALRHTCITIWLLNGVEPANVASAAGTSTAMIERHYKNPRVGTLAGLLNEKVPQVGSFDEDVQAITQMFDRKRLERLEARKHLTFSLQSLHPSAYSGRILGGTEEAPPPRPKPSPEELAALLETTPMYLIGERYGVSGHVVKDWVRKAGLPIPGRGSWAKRRHEARLEGENLPSDPPERLPKPTPEELAKLLEEMPATEIAKRYGVVGPTVLRWAADWGLSRPGRGTWAKRGGEAYRQSKIAKRNARMRGEQLPLQKNGPEGAPNDCKAE
jgi:integrase